MTTTKVHARRRPPTDTVVGLAKTHDNAFTGHPEPPSDLKMRPQDRTFWNRIMRARAYDEWGQVELVVAHQLCRIQADIVTMFAMVDRGDREEMDEAGFPSVRAVNQNIGTLQSQQLNLMRALRMCGTVVGDPMAEIPRRKAEREAEQTIGRLKRVDAEGKKSADEEPLLAL